MELHPLLMELALALALRRRRSLFHSDMAPPLGEGLHRLFATDGPRPPTWRRRLGPADALSAHARASRAKQERQGQPGGLWESLELRLTLRQQRQLSGLRKPRQPRKMALKRVQRLLLRRCMEALPRPLVTPLNDCRLRVAARHCGLISPACLISAVTRLGR